MKMLSFRVSDTDAAEVRRWAERLGVGRSELLHEALRRHLIMLEAEHDIDARNATPLTDEEQALAAVADWGPAEDWSDWADAAG